jgi:hypothetical protein
VSVPCAGGVTIETEVPWHSSTSGTSSALFVRTSLGTGFDEQFDGGAAVAFGATTSAKEEIPAITGTATSIASRLTPRIRLSRVQPAARARIETHHPQHWTNA